MAGFIISNTISNIIVCGLWTYISLKRWIEENDLIVDGPVTERFMLSPVDLPNTDQHIVKIIVPVKPIN